MPVIADTAYPRLPSDPTPAELEAFTPELAELAFARQKARQPGPRLALLVLLETFQHLGRVVRLADVPAAIVDHVAAVAGLAAHTAALPGYGDSTYRVASPRSCAATSALPATKGRRAASRRGPASRRRAPTTTWPIS